MIRPASFMLLALLLVAAVAQGDIALGKKAARVGGFSEVDLTNFESNEEENLVSEAVERSRQVYEAEDGENKWGQLDEVLSVRRQVVAGTLFKIVWSTVKGEKVQISVHQVPWMEQPEQRYPPLK